MKTLSKNKGIIAILAVFIVVMFFYNLFFKPIEEPAQDALSASSIGNELLEIQKELEAVRLDKTLFSSTGYVLFSDFSTPIPVQTTGRLNPFDVIGQD